MRTAVIIGLLALVLGGIFYVIVLRSPTTLDVADLSQKQTTQKVVPSTIPGLDTNVPVGRSNDVWAQSIDSKTQRVVNEFSSEDVAPRPDGSVDVIRPRARFYGKNSGIVTVEGSEGHVFYTQAGARGDAKALGTSTPTSGDLRDVTIRFFEKTLDEEPSIVVTVPAVRFDANSNRISTIDCVVNGQGYAAEQVPVTMRGKDFDFDGQGMTVAWNDREEMLDSLEILKGNRLIVRDISKFIGDEVVTVSNPRNFAPTLGEVLFGMVMVDEASTTIPVATSAPGNKDLYYATFDRDIHVIKNGVEVASGEQMRCVIPLGMRNENTRADRETTQPGTTQKSREHRTPATRKADHPTSAPTTQPQSLEIRWVGKLSIRPVRVVPESPSTQMVELIGSPARVTENQTYATGRLIRIEPEVGRVRIEPGGSVRAIEVRDPNGAELRSRSPLVIDQSTGNAVIEGAGAFNVAKSDQAGAMQISWSKRLSLSLSSSKPAHLQSILVEGEASVNSEKLKLDSSTLELSFDAPAGSGESPRSSRFSMPSPDIALLRKVHARGDALCKVGVDAEARTLAAQDIQLGFQGGDKDALLDSILCDGNVALVDGDKLRLESGTLNLQTKPISLSKGNVDSGPDFFEQIVALSAQKVVKIRRADGSSLDGDELDLSGTDAARRLIVRGSPATLSSAKGSLVGEQIELDPATGDVRVPTAGRFAGSNPDKPGTDVSIAWAESMNLAGKTGECDFVGTVNISGHDEKGAHLVATAKHGKAQFSVVDATTRPSDSALAGIRFDSIRSLSLDGGVNLEVKTTDARSSSMETARLDIDLIAGTLLAPQKGRMLVVDQRKNPETGKGNFGPGALAMQWQEALNWNMRGGELALSGGVRVGFEREGSNDPVRITCNRLTGKVTPIETSNGFDQMSPRIDLKLLRAEGRVMVRSKGASFDAADLVYDLQTQLATAHGTDTKPVEVFDASGSSQIGFSSITWNLQTGLIEDFRDITGQIRR